MGKRENGKFERVPNDLYRTFDPRAVRPLLPHLDPGTIFVEPCAGHGDLIDQLAYHGHRCKAAYDIDPKRGDIRRADALDLRWNTRRGKYITNPPWRRDILHPLIKHLAAQAPTWLLFDSDWLQTDQSSAYLHLLRKVVVVGRVRWIPDTEMDGYDNVQWHLFDGTCPPGPIELFGRI